MNTMVAASQALAFAVSTIADMRVTVGVGEIIAPPTVVIGPPVLEWDGYCGDGLPRRAVWVVYLVEALTDDALDALFNGVPLVAAAIETHTQGVVTGAHPGVYPSPGGPLPAYQLTVAMEL